MGRGPTTVDYGYSVVFEPPTAGEQERGHYETTEKAAEQERRRVRGFRTTEVHRECVRSRGGRRRIELDRLRRPAGRLADVVRRGDRCGVRRPAVDIDDDRLRSRGVDRLKRGRRQFRLVRRARDDDVVDRCVPVVGDAIPNGDRVVLFEGGRVDRHVVPNRLDLHGFERFDGFAVVVAERCLERGLARRRLDRELVGRRVLRGEDRSERGLGLHLSGNRVESKRQVRQRIVVAVRHRDGHGGVSLGDRVIRLDVDSGRNRRGRARFRDRDEHRMLEVDDLRRRTVGVVIATADVDGQSLVTGGGEARAHRHFGGVAGTEHADLVRLAVFRSGAIHNRHLRDFETAAPRAGMTNCRSYYDTVAGFGVVVGHAHFGYCGMRGRRRRTPHGTSDSE